MSGDAQAAPLRRYTPPPMFGRIDHIGVAVEDLDAAIGALRARYGMELVHRETVDEQGVEAVAARRRREPRRAAARRSAPDTPVGKFLAKNGPGPAPRRLPGDDIEATLASLRDAGLRLIDETPRIGIRASHVAFLHPAATGGVLTEIVQPAEVHAMMADNDKRPAHRRRLPRGGQARRLRAQPTTSSTSCARRSATARTAGTRSRPSTARCSSTSRRCSTCGWSPTSTRSASS